MAECTHLIGLLLGTEEDWPTAFETLISRLGPVSMPPATATGSRLSGSRSSPSTSATGRSTSS